jgi:pilus assembly protein Flp/PilA
MKSAPETLYTPPLPGDMMETMRLSTLGALLGDEDGATLVEYSLVVALIAVLCIVAISFLGRSVKSLFSTVGNSVSAA